MRTSNKILLSVFIAVLVILTAIHSAIYAKYKSNNFITSERLHDERYNKYKLDGVKMVSLTGLENVTIIPSDTAMLEMEKRGDAKDRYTFENGVLTIKGDTTFTQSDGTKNREKTYEDIIIYLPYSQIIKSDYSRIFVKGGKDSTKAPSIELDMVDSDLHVGNGDRMDIPASIVFNSIVVKRAERGSVNVANSSFVKKFELNLVGGTFNDNSATFDSLTVSADDNSSISITGKNIPKTTFISKP